MDENKRTSEQTNMYWTEREKFTCWPTLQNKEIEQLYQISEGL